MGLDRATVRRSLGEILIISLGVLCFLYSLYIAIRYAQQPLLDHYSFRQTQTALTSYWLGKNGLSLAYETPVAGPPWSLPFEFPIYQYLVALISKVTTLPLDAVGRLVSFLFLALCLIPARAITRNLSFPPLVFYIFAALLFSSPLYVYWGRTFMIETAAVFFAVAAIRYFLDMVSTRPTRMSALLFSASMTLSILQKATTGLPVLAVLGVAYLCMGAGRPSYFRTFLLTKKNLRTMICLAIPLAIGVAWTLYSDQVKMLNGLGRSLTSSALTEWNFGTLAQRASSELYGDAIWKRLFEQNLSGALGVAVLAIAFLSGAKGPARPALAVAVAMGLIPMLLFSNLHIIHSYYQTANLIFLIYALAVAVGYVLNDYFDRKMITFVLAAIMVVSNFFWFSKEYLPVVKAEYNKASSRDFAVAEVLKREVPAEKHFVAFGNDWSSSFGYLAERKSFTVPGFFSEYGKIAAAPERFVPEGTLGAVVVCPPIKQPTIDDLGRWSSTQRSWKIGQVHGCYVAVPGARAGNATSKPTSASCLGNLDIAGKLQTGNHDLLTVAGWTAIAGEVGGHRFPERVYVTLAKKNAEPIYFEALQVNRPDVNVHLRQPDQTDFGFSRIIYTRPLAGDYVVGISRLNGGLIESCQFERKVMLGGEKR